MGRIRQSVIGLRDRRPRVIRLAEREGDSEAAYDLAVTTHRFSRRAQEMVDDKLSLSATLMRAGEVDEARRLLLEAEQDLRSEEAALMRQVEQLGTYRDLHRPRVVVLERDRTTRFSLMRTLAVAVASSAVVALATMGGAVIGLFQEPPQIERRIAPAIGGDDISRARTIRPAGAARGVAVRINGIRVILTRAEWRALKRAQRNGGDEAVSDLLGIIAPELTASAPGGVIELIDKIGKGAGDVADDTDGSADDDADASNDDGDAASDEGSSGGTAEGDTSEGSTGGESNGGGTKGGTSGGATEDDGGGGSETGGSTTTPDAGDIIGSDDGDAEIGASQPSASLGG